jgi:hypothetical protein
LTFGAAGQQIHVRPPMNFRKRTAAIKGRNTQREILDSQIECRNRRHIGLLFSVPLPELLALISRESEDVGVATYTPESSGLDRRLRRYGTYIVLCYTGTES